MISPINLPNPERATAPNLSDHRWNLSKRENWDTPRKLLGMAAAVVLATICLFFSINNATSESKNAVRSIGKDCAPSIVAAQEIAAALADFDANTTNELICEPGSKDMKVAMDTVQQRHTEITNNLVKAAENITFGDNERVPIDTMTDNLGKYETTMEEAKILLQTGHPEEAVKTGRIASDLMHDVLLPAAEQLDKANRSVLDRTFESHRNLDVVYLALVMASGIVLLAMLAFAQYFIFRKMKRILNPGLVVASAIAIMLTGYAADTLVNTNEIVRSAVKDAFDSVHFLWHARAIAYDANGDETRWLFDRADANRYADSFFAKSKSLAEFQSRTLTDLPENVSCKSLADMANGKDPEAADFKGYLADELKNITFPGELEAATATLEYYSEYLQADKKIRKLEEEGRHAQAIQFCLSNEDGGSNFLFDKFDHALGQTLNINQKAFDEDIEMAFQHLDPFTYITPIAVLLITASAIFGFWERIKEYSI
jgi:hypothetical protein